MLRIVNISGAVDDGKHRERSIDAITKIAVHRVGKALDARGVIHTDLGNTAEEICDAFLRRPDVAAYTGGEIAYTFIIEADGTIKQCLPIDDVGAHAKRWNVPALGVALIGDFRYQEPTYVQYKALVDLLVELCRAWGLNPKDAVHGHTELPGASADPAKRCPGALLDMPTLRYEVLAVMREDARYKLSKAGLAWKRG